MNNFALQGLLKPNMSNAQINDSLSLGVEVFKFFFILYTIGYLTI